MRFIALVRVLAAAMILPFVAAGCAATDGLVPVTGIVTLDGSPVESGSVQFYPTAGDAPTTGAVIANGAFAARVPAGSMKVVIVAPKVVGKRKTSDAPGDPEADVLKESIPAKYNTASTLTADIRPGMPALDFALSTK